MPRGQQRNDTAQTCGALGKDGRDCVGQITDARIHVVEQRGLHTARVSKRQQRWAGALTRSRVRASSIDATADRHCATSASIRSRNWESNRITSAPVRPGEVGTQAGRDRGEPTSTAR